MTTTQTADTITAKQVAYIRVLETKTGHKWTEWVNCPAGADITAMPKAIASKVIAALIAASPAAPARTHRTHTTGRTGQSGRCVSCGAHLDHLSAGGYCFDCQ